MSLVSSSTGITPAPSKPTLNLRGSPKSVRSLRMWKCHSRAYGRVSISSCGSMPAVGVPVTLRMLSAPAPREHKPEILDRLDHVDGVLRLDLADLQVGARRHMGVGTAVALGDVGEAGELPMLEDAVGDAQAAHVRALRRRDIEQAIEAPAEIVGGLGRLVAARLILQALIGIERMLLALEFLLVGELAAGRNDAVLRPDVHRIRTRRLGFRRRAAPRCPGGGQAGHEAFEVALLVGAEVAGHGPPHAAMRSTRLRPNTRSLRIRSIDTPWRMRSRYQRPSSVSP